MGPSDLLVPTLVRHAQSADSIIDLGSFFTAWAPNIYIRTNTHRVGVHFGEKKTLGFDLPLGDGEIGLGRNAACLPLCLCPLNRRPHRAFYKRLPVPSTLFLPLHNALNALCGRHCGAFAPFGP